MLTVLQVAFPLAPVHEAAVGGAEQVVHLLDAALSREGHRSIVVACAGSRVVGELVATPAPPRALGEAEKQAAWAQHRAAIELVLARRRVDLVHLHGIDFHRYLPPPDQPALATLHLPLDWYPPAIFALGIRLNCVSLRQREAGGAAARALPIVPNGIALDAFIPARKRRYVVALGRICPEKGFHLALDAAREAGMPLALAGRLYPYAAHQRYFANEIAPRLDRRRRFLGPLEPRERRRLLAGARCLLVTSQVAETSSLVAMEALASGTPVVAFRRGALPDIVEHGRTGFLVDDAAQLAGAIEACAGLAPEECRAVAEARFSATRMARDYLRLYAEIAGTSPIERSSGLPPSNSATVSEPTAMSSR
jgi:glycosyltransferase involved in cell wall biosynthesis